MTIFLLKSFLDYPITSCYVNLFEVGLQADLKKVGFEGRPMNEPQAIAFFEERLRAAVYAAIRQTPLKFE